eukprot:5529692-Prymnesium_polylepis.4
MLQSSTQVRLSGFRHTDVHITSASPAGRQVQLAHTSRGSKQNRTELTHHMGCGVGGVGSTRPAPSLRFSQPVRIEAFAEPARWLARAHAVNERREAAPHHDAVGDADDVAVQRGAGAAEERRGLAAAVKEEVGQVEEAEDAEAHECERGVVPAISGVGGTPYEMCGVVDGSTAASKRGGRGGGSGEDGGTGGFGRRKKVRRCKRRGGAGLWAGLDLSAPYQATAGRPMASPYGWPR